MQNHIQISRKNPTAFLFVVDQSASMGYIMPSIGKPKAKHVADVINRTILNLIDLCNKADGVRDYFHVGVICYSGKGVSNGLFKDPQKPILNLISDAAVNIIGVETVIDKIDNGLGEIVERRAEFPVWVEAEADGQTPMCEAFTKAKDALRDWCDEYQDSYPPTLIHVTDGDSTDGNPEAIAEDIKNISTLHGNTLIFNIHVSSFSANIIKYPYSDIDIQDEYAKQLFRMSSVFPQYLVDKALQRDYKINNGSRGFVFNADAAEIVNFLEIGTLPATQSWRQLGA
ncbi:MAG: hypothetical protein LBJ88_00555 [Campylobacteraceae bacterium]|jgi:hypothetical protein|nr:hypothetical protein [Campylobacteraceae bacterium]